MFDEIRRVLLVEDDSDSPCLRSIVAGRGFQVVTVRTAEEAVSEFIKDVRINLVITDIDSPSDGAGLRIAEAAVAVRPATGVILTADAGDFDQKSRDAAAFGGLLRRPFEEREFIAKVADVARLMKAGQRA